MRIKHKAFFDEYESIAKDLCGSIDLAKEIQEGFDRAKAQGIEYDEEKFFIDLGNKLKEQVRKEISIK